MLGTLQAGLCSYSRMIYTAFEPLHGVSTTAAAAGKHSLPQVLRTLPSTLQQADHITASS